MLDEAAPTALAFTNNDCSYGARGCMTLPSAPNNQMVGETPNSFSETSGRYLVENSRLHNSFNTTPNHSTHVIKTINLNEKIIKNYSPYPSRSKR